MPTNDSKSLAGQTLNERYFVQELIGQGPQAIVYKGEDRKRNLKVALKLLAHPALSSEGTDFQQGIEGALALAHPNIVRLYGADVTKEGVPFLVMDCVPGQNLSQLLAASGALSVRTCISIFTQVCDALQHAHAKGMMHGDLKPGNVLLISAPGDTFMVKVSDFTGRRGDERSDIYAAGCMLFEALTGASPDPGDGALPPSLPPPVAGMPQADALQAILNRAMASDCRQRYQSAGQMSHDLNLMNEAAGKEWSERALCTKLPAPVQRAGKQPGAAVQPAKRTLLLASAGAIFVAAAAASIAVLALADPDIKPLLKYKLAAQEVLLPPGDPRLIRNLTAMITELKSNHRYADAWQYQEKLLHACGAGKDNIKQ